jgi:hypothetical protein
MAETDAQIDTRDFLWEDGGFFDEVADERVAQHLKWGVQHWPGGTATSPDDKVMADEAKRATGIAMHVGDITWRDILIEEVLEAFAEGEWSKLRVELVQSAAVIAAWVEDGDRAASEAAGGPVPDPRASAAVHHADQGAEGRD